MSTPEKIIMIGCFFLFLSKSRVRGGGGGGGGLGLVVEEERYTYVLIVKKSFCCSTCLLLTRISKD